MIDFSAVPILDSTAAATIDGFVRKANRHDAAVYIVGARRPVRRVLLIHGIRPPPVRYRPTIPAAIAAVHGKSEMPDDEPAEAPALQDQA